MPLNHKEGKMRVSCFVISLAVALISGCASTPESVTTEHKGKVTLVHHRRRTNNGLVDKIEAINPNGIVTQAEVHVYDIGRLPHGQYGMDEAHRYYQVVQSQRLNLMLPQGTHPTGPKTVYTPPSYVPPPKDQRVTDAIAQAKEAQEKLEAAARQVEDRLKEDNDLRGELQAQIDENQRLQDQVNAGFATPQHPPTPGPTPLSDAEKAARAAVDSLIQWGQKVDGQQ
jgi:hypothetical protein